MEIILNGETTEIPEDISAQGLLQHLGMAEKQLALEVNQSIIPRSQYADVSIQANDKIEIVHAIGGG